jgi:hypothetical protein
MRKTSSSRPSGKISILITLQFAFRERARLVHRDHIDLGELFDRRAAAEQHATPGAPGDRGQNGRRNRQNERTGAHHDQQRHANDKTTTSTSPTFSKGGMPKPSHHTKNIDATMLSVKTV